LNVAQSRAKELKLSYEGALMPDEAYEIMQTAPGAILIDVRSRAELEFVGRIPGAIEIELLIYPGMKPNMSFMAAMEQQVDKESLLMFICRSGGRSHQAAQIATQAGWQDCYNVLVGFEGDVNAKKHRSVLNGWKALGLPWEQS
jgi:rhodanese-related sulfurtransferase